ncbi:metal-dependent hydrolase [Agrobacterium tumefaciens]|uniref:Metal-dependent hydrolase n=1 Tax=Agrobacterium tumefaciens TaxID=358 RepID=A0A0D0L1X7_AGRTU|nr:MULTISPECIES: ABC transporter ATP-binding protein [unclassified Rhizobium]KIQ03705.1 metal-dependent hydrolase [Agrobacterium tumefaciens]MCI9867541.1 ABC transporter ATP-binding protein [Rhizobium skierniewicense]
MTVLLQIDDLHVSYGKVEAVRGVSFKVRQGEVATVIGPNGAGKTTMMSAIMGMMPSLGTISFNGQPIGRLSVEERVELGICLVPEKRELFAEMSVRDNLVLGAYSVYQRQTVKAELEVIYELFPRLKQRRQQEAGTLSGGERQMLALGRALMSKPKLLILDEPSLGLAPLIVHEIFAKIGVMRGQGLSVLLVEQNAKAALQLADTGYVLETGEIVQQGEAKGLMDDPRLVSIYLGGH